MRLAIGPPCPRCGCNDMELIDADRHNGPWAKFRCSNCEQEAILGRNPGKAGLVNSMAYTNAHCHCPRCGAKNPPVLSKQGKVRYHRCETCGTNLKSIEVGV